MKLAPQDGAERWVPNEPRPSNFDVAAYQRLIDQIVGTRDGRSIIKLAWAPEELRWRPYPHGTEPHGYTFPIFIAYHDSEGNEVSAPRWVLLERIEPEQYAPTWEATRYSMYGADGETLRLWDWAGPCPTERYVELKAWCYHDGKCCPCLGDECKCGPEYFHCWGRYLEPNERLLDWIRKTSWEALRDPDVNPTQDIRHLESARAQMKLRSQLIEGQQKKIEEDRALNEFMLDHWKRKPVSTSGFKESNYGLLLPN